MNACQHHFPVSPGHQSFHLSHHVLRLPASDPASGIWDDAVAAELITAVLDLDKGPGVFSQAAYMKLLILLIPGNIQHIAFLISLPVPHIFFQYIRQTRLIVIADNDIHAAVFLQGIGRHLDITARRHHHSLRIQLLCTVEHLAGFAVRDIGHGACIDNIDVSLLVKGHDFITALRQLLFHGLRLISVYFASQVMQGCFWHCKTSCSRSVTTLYAGHPPYGSLTKLPYCFCVFHAISLLTFSPPVCSIKAKQDSLQT